MRLHKDVLPGLKFGATFAHAKVMRNWYVTLQEMPTQGALELAAFDWIELKGSSLVSPVRVTTPFMGHLHQLALRGVESRVEAFLLGVLVLLEVLNGALPRPSAARLGDVLVEVMIPKSLFDTVSVEHHYRLVAPRAGAFDSRSHISNFDQRILRVVKLLVRVMSLGLYLRV